MAKYAYVAHGEPGIELATLTGITQANLDGFALVKVMSTGTNSYIIEGYWTTGTFTQATYNAFPVGSIVHDFVGFTLNYKTGATTWKAVTLT